MLDRATIERLSRTPEKNAPMLNVALAEEGFAPVLLALARSPAVGPEAIQVINERIANEGDDVGRDREAPADEHFVSQAAELDRLLAAHPNASGHALDSIVARHPNDPFFILAAATHPRATITGVLRAVDWPAASPMHDRLWLALLDPALVPPLTLEEWAQDAQNPLRREAAARIGRDAASLRTLSHDKDRRVRRAVASNRHAGDERHRLAHEDPAPEVRARAGGPRGYGGEAGHGEPSEAARDGTSIVETARFAAALRAMNAGGVLAPDVVRALAGPAEKLDEEGAFFAAVVLPRAELLQCLELVLDLGMHSPQAKNLAAGLALRPPVPPGTPAAEEPEGEHADLVYDAVKSLSRTTTADSRLTGKARLCAWTAEGLAAAQVIEPGRIAYELEKNPLAADRMILARSCAIRPSLAQDLYAPEPPGPSSIPASVLEIAWSDPAAPDALVIDLAGRVAKAKKRAEDILEDEVDLDPSRRSLETLERVVLAATQRVIIAPRAALPVIALDARRVRYILSAMPQWKGRLTGGRLARVLRQHAGALSAAQAEARHRASKVEGWTERLLSEIELSIALAVGHLTGAEVARRILSGRQVVDDGISLASGAEARAVMEGPEAIAAILKWASAERLKRPAALAAWLLLEKFDRERAPTLIASAIDTVTTEKGAAPASVTDALATLERRRPARLEAIHPQSARGRATLASAIAKAYRAVGGMSHERQGP
ncbi:MAG: hypothetical protein L6Q76_11480 [Polyangiaceae bacterium]|nr:hypothetical protein [Polyangiaceae bacterium]